jgi:hypothetical protein
VEQLDPPAPSPPLPEDQQDGPGEEFTTKPCDGFYRVYPHRPTVDPDKHTNVTGTNDVPTFSAPAPDRSGWFQGMTRSLAGLLPSNIYSPFANATHFWLYYYNRSSVQKSKSDLNDLIGVLKKPEVSLEDIGDFSAEKGNAALDKHEDTFSPDDGWDSQDISIPVPCPSARVPEKKAPVFDVTGLRFRRIVSVITSAFQSSSFHTMHLTPFKLFKVQPNGDSERAYSELYNSDAYYNKHVKVRDEFKSQTSLEVVLAALMIWSDSTHLATFGPASLWPIYLFFGNQSKYIRGKPTTFSAHHIAYIPSVGALQNLLYFLLTRHQFPATFSGWFQVLFGKLPKTPLLTFMKRELMQRVWRVLLGADFIHAYLHGVVIRCADGVERLVFPRIFTYSADYPEK